MANLAKDLNVALKVAEEGAKIARKAKVKPTVKEAERIAYPGIYDDPRVIAEKAASRVAPESTAMKQLFGVTRDDLYEMSKGRKGNIEGKLPGAAENPKGSKAAEKVITKKNEQRLLDALYESEKYPELVKGMDPWYTMDPLFKHMVQIMGEEKAIQEYKKFNTLLGMASPGSEVTTEIPRGTAAYFLQKEGRFPEFEEFAGMPAAKRREIDFPQDILNVPGHMYHKTAHSIPMAKFLETGELGMDSPKVPMYIEASGVPETGFQTDVPVGDAHWSRAVGLGDTRTSKNFGASVSTPEMSMLAPWWRKKIAGEVGIESVPAQARTWGLFSPQTGVTTPIGKPKLEMISDKIMETAIRLNISPEDARDLVLTGKTYAGKKDGGAVNMAGGGPLKALDKAIKVGERAVKEAAKKDAEKTVKQVIETPTIIKPSTIAKVRDRLLNEKQGGDQLIRRLERAADEVPGLEKQFDEQALFDLFGRVNAGWEGNRPNLLKIIHPSEFSSKYAAELPTMSRKPTYSRDPGSSKVNYSIDDPRLLSNADYVDYLANEVLKNQGGFDRAPNLSLNYREPSTHVKQPRGTPQLYISGHEGRHRTAALDKAGFDKTIVEFDPGRDLRDLLISNVKSEPPVYRDRMTGDTEGYRGFYDQDRFLNNFKKLFGEQPRISPEVEGRSPVSFEDFFAEGGSAKKPSFFPKDSKPHKQGYPIEYEEYYPRSTRPESELLDEFRKNELTAKDYLKAVPTIAKTAGKMLKEQAVEELPTYTEPRAIPDIALNALATGVGSISDLAFLGSGVDRPPLGSERLMDMLEEYGVTSGTKRPLAENLLAIASPKVLRTAESGLNALRPAVERSFTPITTTVEAVAPDLAKFKPRDFQEYVTNRMISSQYGGTPMNIMGDEVTSKLPAQGVYFNDAGQLETNPMMAIDVPNVSDISKAKELRADIASAGKALNQESMAGFRFLPLTTNRIEDATAILVKPKNGKISNEDVIRLGNEFGNSMVVSHNPRLGGVVLAPFDKPQGELQIAQSKIKDLFGSDMNIRAGHSDLIKDRFYMPKKDYAKEGARKVPKSTQALREELKKAESLRYREPSFLSDTNPLTGGKGD